LWSADWRILASSSRASTCSAGASALRMTLWIVGLLGWFFGGVVSFGHALN
jgi:hypothetical protein